MLQVFRDCCRRALREAGPPGCWHSVGRTMLDTVQTALEEHVQRGVDMSKEKVYQTQRLGADAGRPVLTGLWLPLLAIVSIIVERVSGRFVEIPVVAVQVTLGLTLAGLFGLGYLLQSDSRTVGRQTAAQ
jgi:hypothetical protein